MPKSIKCTTARVNPKLWTLGGVGSSTVTSAQLWCKILIVGGAVHMWGQGAYGKSIPSAQFCCESETTIKIKVLIKKEKASSKKITAE